MTGHSKKRIGPSPAPSAALVLITLAGVPSRVSLDAARHANATGIIGCDGATQRKPSLSP